MSEHFEQIGLQFAPSHPAQPKFDGSTIVREADEPRLSGQMRAVYELMRDRSWRTLGKIVTAISGGSEAGASARLRDLRKQKWGAHEVLRRRRGDAKAGLFEYSLLW